MSLFCLCLTGLNLSVLIYTYVYIYICINFPTGMDLLSAIGTGIVGKIAEYTVEPVGRQVGYVIHCKCNLANLQARVEELRAARWGIDNVVVKDLKHKER